MRLAAQGIRGFPDRCQPAVGEGGGNQIRAQPLRRLALPGQLAVARPGRGCHGPQMGRVSLRFLDQHLH